MIAAAAAGCLLVAGCGGNEPSNAGDEDAGEDGELTLVQFGGQRVAADAGLFIADERGYFAEEGIEFEYVRMNDASAITNALSTGQLDVAGATITPGTFAAAEQDLGIKIVGDKNFQAPAQGDRPAISATRLGVLPEYDEGDLAATLEALRGKRIAVHSELSIQNVYLSSTLAMHGFSMDDFTITPVLSPDQTAALVNGAIEAAVMQEPYFSQAVNEEIVHEADDFTGSIPEEGASMTALLYSTDMLENEELGQSFMNAYIRGVRDYNDAMYYDTGKDEVVAIVAEAVDVPVESLADAHPAGLDPDQNIGLDWLQECFDYYVSTGEIDYELDINTMVDTRFRDSAIEELGAYEPPAG